MKKIGVLILVVLFSAIGCKVQKTSQKEDVRSLRGNLPLKSQSEAPKKLEWYTGETAVKRSYAQQPPVVPHEIDDYEISLTGNACMNCHGNPDTGAPGLSSTHYEDREGNVLKTLAARRHFCTQCHVPQAAINPIVGNTFSSGG